MTEAVTLEVNAGVATITLNLPDLGNPIGADLTPALQRAVDEVSAMTDLRVLVLTGAGAIFCVGGDIKGTMTDFETLSKSLGDSLPQLNAMMEQLAHLPVPVVCAINGPVGGGGIALALCGDIVIAAESAKLRGGYTAIGLSPDLGASLFLTRRVGPTRAKRIFFLNEAIDSATCLDWGIYDEVVPDAVLASRVGEVVEQLRNSATAAIGRTKTLVHQAVTASLEEQLAAERQGMIASGKGMEAKEGVAAFMEKRAPRFA